MVLLFYDLVIISQLIPSGCEQSYLSTASFVALTNVWSFTIPNLVSYTQNCEVDYSLFSFAPPAFIMSYEC